MHPYSFNQCQYMIWYKYASVQIATFIHCLDIAASPEHKEFGDSEANVLNPIRKFIIHKRTRADETFMINYTGIKLNRRLQRFTLVIYNKCIIMFILIHYFQVVR